MVTWSYGEREFGGKKEEMRKSKKKHTNSDLER